MFNKTYNPTIPHSTYGESTLQKQHQTLRGFKSIKLGDKNTDWLHYFFKTVCTYVLLVTAPNEQYNITWNSVTEKCLLFTEMLTLIHPIKKSPGSGNL